MAMSRKLRGLMPGKRKGEGPAFQFELLADRAENFMGGLSDQLATFLWREKTSKEGDYTCTPAKPITGSEPYSCVRWSETMSMVVIMQLLEDSDGFAPKLFQFKVQVLGPEGANGKRGAPKTLGKATVDLAQFCSPDGARSPAQNAVLPLKPQGQVHLTIRTAYVPLAAGLDRANTDAASVSAGSRAGGGLSRLSHAVLGTTSTSSSTSSSTRATQPPAVAAAPSPGTTSASTAGRPFATGSPAGPAKAVSTVPGVGALPSVSPRQQAEVVSGSAPGAAWQDTPARPAAHDLAVRVAPHNSGTSKAQQAQQKLPNGMEDQGSSYIAPATTSQGSTTTRADAAAAAAAPQGIGMAGIVPSANGSSAGSPSTPNKQGWLRSMHTAYVSKKLSRAPSEDLSAENPFNGHPTSSDEQRRSNTGSAASSSGGGAAIAAAAAAPALLEAPSFAPYHRGPPPAVLLPARTTSDSAASVTGAAAGSPSGAVPGPTLRPLGGAAAGPPLSSRPRASLFGAFAASAPASPRRAATGPLATRRISDDASHIAAGPASSDVMATAGRHRWCNGSSGGGKGVPVAAPGAVIASPSPIQGISPGLPSSGSVASTDAPGADSIMAQGGAGAGLWAAGLELNEHAMANGGANGALGQPECEDVDLHMRVLKLTAERDLWQERAVRAGEFAEQLHDAAVKSDRERASWQQVARALQATNDSLNALVRVEASKNSPEDQELLFKYMEAKLKLAEQEQIITELRRQLLRGPEN